MKRIIATILAFIMLLCWNNAIAEEDFILRNGILFGDTLEEVKSKETLPLTIEESRPVWAKGEIAGMKGGIRFDFYHDQLAQMLYNFEAEEIISASAAAKKYAALREALITKYGEPGTDEYRFKGAAFDYMLANLALMKGECLSFDEWIVETNGYKVKISLVAYKYTYKKVAYYNICLSYSHVTLALFDANKENVTEDKEDNAAIMNDI